METERNGYNVNRGDEIIGPRVTVYHVHNYLVNGWSKQEILGILPITAEQFDAAVRYIDEHRAEVEAVHKGIEERNARGNTPEVLAKLEASHRRFEALRASIRSAQSRETHDAGNPGRR